MVIMKEIVRQTPELREAVYSLINRDVERALSGLESVKPSQVPRQEGAWAPEHSVTEFSHSQEAKLAEAQQKAMLKGEAFPDIPMTLYEAIVRDYTGRTPEAREQTLIVTHLNEDRRVLNSMIHDAREKAGELGKEQVMVPVLNTANIRDGELRRLSTWENNPDALALVDSVYHRIAGISKDDGLITLEDAEGNTRLISPREAVAEGVTLYTPDKIRVSGTSYGIAGLLMLAVSHRLYRAEDRAERLALVACLLAVIPALNLATSDAAAVAGLVMTVLTVGLVSCAGKSLPRFWPGDFFPVFYACHLAVLGVLAL
ncbi:type-F conjugative transfer system pilin acetylase TraX [Escherichia coli]|nr:type-F conjugative transfer system pilin acetylase TraX [Escherichia coli]